MLRSLTAAPMHRIKRREGTPFAPPPAVCSSLFAVGSLDRLLFRLLGFPLFMGALCFGLQAPPANRCINASHQNRREGTPCAPLPPLVPACLQPVLLTGCFFVCLVLPYSWARCTLGCMLDALTAPRRCFIYAFALRFSTMRATAASTSSRDVARFMRTHAPKRSPPNQSP